MLKPKRLANHKMAKMGMGANNSSVCCRNGRAIFSLTFDCFRYVDELLTIVSKKGYERVVPCSYEIYCVAQE